MRSAHDSVENWIRQFRKWLNRLFGKAPTDRPRSRILATRESAWIRLLLLEADFEDESVIRIRMWRGILRSPETQFDILLCCDRLKRNRTGANQGVRFTATHRYAVFRVHRMATKGRIRSDCLLIADLDCVEFQVVRLDGFAPQIADSLAVQLSKRSPQELRALTNFEDENGKEIPGERLRVQARWLSILKAYHLEYFPVTGLER